MTKLLVCAASFSSALVSTCMSHGRQRCVSAALVSEQAVSVVGHVRTASRASASIFVHVREPFMSSILVMLELPQT